MAFIQVPVFIDNEKTAPGLVNVEHVQAVRPDRYGADKRVIILRDNCELVSPWRLEQIIAAMTGEAFPD